MLSWLPARGVFGAIFLAGESWVGLRGRIFMPVLDWMGRQRPRTVMFATTMLVLAIGLWDYLLGVEITLSVIYAFPISIMAWYVGAGEAILISILSVLLWIGGDFAAGLKVSSPMIPVYNGVLRLIFYLFLIQVLVRLRSLHKNLEHLADTRAQALLRATSERERLEHEMLEIAEREQRRIGQDLHDGLCQHLTGTALAGQLLAERLAGKEIAEARTAREVVDLVEEAITLARGMAKGLHPVELKAEGLMQALEEFCATTSELFGVKCQFECQMPVLVEQPSTAIHLYRIAQEGVSNAIKHGRASKILVQLEEVEEGTQLLISDNGSGLAQPLPPRSGMGLRIMADRAKMIGGRFTISPSAPGGVELRCLIPAGMPEQAHG